MDFCSSTLQSVQPKTFKNVTHYLILTPIVFVGLVECSAIYGTGGLWWHHGGPLGLLSFWQEEPESHWASKSKASHPSPRFPLHLFCCSQRSQLGMLHYSCHTLHESMWGWHKHCSRWLEDDSDVCNPVAAFSLPSARTALSPWWLSCLHTWETAWLYGAKSREVNVFIQKCFRERVSFTVFIYILFTLVIQLTWHVYEHRRTWVVCIW